MIGQVLFLYQKLQDSLVTKYFNTMTVQKLYCKPDSNIAEKKAKERGRLHGKIAGFDVPINLLIKYS